MNNQKPAFNPIKIEKRLQLNKETVSRLQSEQMLNIVGGQSSYTCPTTYTCPSGPAPIEPVLA